MKKNFRGPGFAAAGSVFAVFVNRNFEVCVYAYQSAVAQGLR